MEPVFWLITLAVLLVVEVTTLGLTTIWFAAGALVAFLASLFGAGLILQIVFFAVFSLLLLLAVRPYAVRFFNNKRAKTNYEGLIGREVKVTEEIDNFNQKGAVFAEGISWTARSARDDKIIPAGERVRVVRVSGVKLIVSDEKEEV